MKVIITADGLHGKEVNPLGDCPNKPDQWLILYFNDPIRQKYRDDYYTWHETERNLKTYEMEECIRVHPLVEIPGVKEPFTRYEFLFVPGSIHEAELLPNGKIKILD